MRDIIGGFIAEALAKLTMPGHDSDGLIVTIILGRASSVVATGLGRTLGWYHGDRGSRFIGLVAVIIIIIIIIIIILTVYRFLIHRRMNGTESRPT